MSARSVITKKKSGSELSTTEIEEIIGGYTSGSVPDSWRSVFRG
jgi:thymidine phosphorylase